MARAPVLVSGGLLALLAACPPDRADVLQCGVVAHDALVACPSERALATHLRERWGLSQQAEITPRCLPGHFGGAGWLIEASATDAGATASALFVLQPSCGALTDASLHPGPLHEATYELYDLDGDGVDEVLARTTERDPVGTSTSLEALRIGGGRFHRGGKIRIAYQGVDPDLPDKPPLTCTGTVRFLNHPDKGWLVEITATRSLESALCLATGAHRFELGLHGLRRR